MPELSNQNENKAISISLSSLAISSICRIFISVYLMNKVYIIDNINHTCMPMKTYTCYYVILAILS